MLLKQHLESIWSLRRLSVQTPTEMFICLRCQPLAMTTRRSCLRLASHENHSAASVPQWALWGQKNPSPACLDAQDSPQVSVDRLCCYGSGRLHSHGRQRSGSPPWSFKSVLSLLPIRGPGKSIRSHNLEDLPFSKYLISPRISSFQPISLSQLWRNSSLLSNLPSTQFCSQPWNFSIPSEGGLSVLSCHVTWPRTLETQARKRPCFSCPPVCASAQRQGV